MEADRRLAAHEMIYSNIKPESRWLNSVLLIAWNRHASAARGAAENNPFTPALRVRAARLATLRSP